MMETGDGRMCIPWSTNTPLGGWLPYGKPCRSSVLDGQRDWLRQRFLAHRGNADVVRQELEREKGIRVYLRTVERAVERVRSGRRQAIRRTVGPSRRVAPGRGRS